MNNCAKLTPWCNESIIGSFVYFCHMKLKSLFFVLCFCMFNSVAFSSKILLVLDNEWEWCKRVNYIVTKDTASSTLRNQMMNVLYTTIQNELTALGHQVTVMTQNELQKVSTENIYMKSKFSPKPVYHSWLDKWSSISPYYTMLNTAVPELQLYMAAQLTQYDYVISLNRIVFSHNFWKAFFNRGKRQINFHYDIIGKDGKLILGKNCQYHMILKKIAQPHALVRLMNAPAKHWVQSFSQLIEKK